MALTINEAFSLSKPESASSSARHVETMKPGATARSTERSSTVRPGMGQYKPGHGRQGAGLALLTEVLLVIVAVLIFNHSTSIKLAMTEPVPIMVLTEKLPPAPPVKTTPLPQLKNKLILTEPKVVALPPEPAVTTPLPPVASPQNTITEPPPAPPPPPPRANGDIDPSAEYAARVHAAVQAAVYYPPAAVAMHYSGRVRVEFHLRDGIPAQAHILIGSNIGMIDRAALESVQNAHYPAPPPEMRGNERLYQVWVEFTH